ncbi:hypothetical protein [Corynebacterium phocae]|uniref:hypothetical protein n=1 Tax=Corynebacterium phocae TaxID=161895 RepID=UPI00123B11D3|nr:hypothetical protein [Corynebacterium phocae]KAA8723189.1 hypothetical protein F4V58_07705 [Corynebacterium phocae]
MPAHVRHGRATPSMAPTPFPVSSDTSCEVSGDAAETGTATFTVTNDGEKTTEFYVFTSGGRVLGEVETLALALPASW